MRSTPWLSALAALSLLAACSSDDADPPAAPVVRGPITLAAPAAACVAGEDTADLEKHACLHARSGPFASASAGAEDGAPAVSKSHTSYEISLSGAPSWVAYRAKAAGLYAIYTNPTVRVAVRGAAGAQLAVDCEGPTTGACDLLPYVTQVRLGANEEVRVAFYPDAGVASVKVIIEEVE